MGNGPRLDIEAISRILAEQGVDYLVVGGICAVLHGAEWPICLRIAVSPDGRTVLYSQADETGSDLMLVGRTSGGAEIAGQSAR